MNEERKINHKTSPRLFKRMLAKNPELIEGENFAAMHDKVSRLGARGPARGAAADVCPAAPPLRRLRRRRRPSKRQRCL